MPTKSVRCVVSGRVQGVFFRATTVECANTLGLKGWAKNLPDGTVEVVAAGDDKAIASLAAWLWQGPPTATVTDVRIDEWTDPIPSTFTTR